jgi:AcrR family transcriptional regulator
MGRTQEQRRAETRARLLAAAADLFARKGFHATSAEAVAGAAERTTGALYDHFGGKEGLLVGLLEQWIEQTIVDLTGVLEVEPDLDARLGALWDGVIRRDSETGDAWLLLEFELWLHAVRDPQLGVVGAERFHVMREALGVGLGEWADEFGFALPADGDELAVQIIGLLVGAAFQYRLDPAAVPKRTVVAGLRRLLDLPADAPMVASTSGTGTDHRNEGAAP